MGWGYSARSFVMGPHGAFQLGMILGFRWGKSQSKTIQWLGGSKEAIGVFIFPTYLPHFLWGGASWSQRVSQASDRTSMITVPVRTPMTKRKAHDSCWCKWWDLTIGQKGGESVAIQSCRGRLFGKDFWALSLWCGNPSWQSNLRMSSLAFGNGYL